MTYSSNILIIKAVLPGRGLNPISFGQTDLGDVVVMKGILLHPQKRWEESLSRLIRFISIVSNGVNRVSLPIFTLIAISQIEAILTSTVSPSSIRCFVVGGSLQPFLG